MPEKPSLTRKQEQHRHELLIRFIVVLDNIVRLAIPWGSAIFIAYLIARAVESLAGKATFASIGVSVLGDLRVDKALAYLFGGCGIGYGARERALRRSTVARLTKRITDLELRLDPKRSSTKLPPKGTTRPEDRP